MNNDLRNISSPGNNNAGKNDLLNDLNEDLNAANEFEQDAAEGLQQLPKADIPSMVQKLNTELSHSLGKKKKRRQLPDQSYVYITIIIILLLITVAYIILRRSMQ